MKLNLFIICTLLLNISPIFAEISNRSKIICISDIHMGDERSITKTDTLSQYGWFSEPNTTYLTDFLNNVLEDNSVKQLVILGDLFEEWICPHDIDPLDNTTTQNFFYSIANAEQNKSSIKLLKEIAANPEIELIYIPGNHDMLLDKKTLETIIPGIIFMSDARGLGKYVSEGLVMEHGHRYDLWNAPFSFKKKHILPLGYYMSRAFATKATVQKEQDNSSLRDVLKKTSISKGIPEKFDIPTRKEAVKKLRKNYTTKVNPIDANLPLLIYYMYTSPKIVKFPVIMGGIDLNFSPKSLLSISLEYFNLLNKWDKISEINQIKVPFTAEDALINGFDDLSAEALRQYFLYDKANIVVFGHTHKGMIKGWDIDLNPVTDKNKTCAYIYANTGTWVNLKPVSAGYETCTYVELDLNQTEDGILSGTVTLYKYIPDAEDEIIDQRKLLADTKGGKI